MRREAREGANGGIAMGMGRGEMGRERRTKKARVEKEAFSVFHFRFAP